MNKIKKSILPFSLLTLAAVLIGVFFIYSKNTQSASGFVKPQRGDISRQLRFSGKIEAENTFDLGFERSGKISKIYVNVGDKVKKGQLLAELDSQDASISYSQAIADRQVVQAQLEQAQKNEDIQKSKLKSMKESDSANKYDKNAQKKVIDQTQSAIDAQVALLQKADEAVRNSSLQRNKTKMYAPADGVVTRQSLEQGETVSAYAPVISLMGDSTLEIQAYVSELEVKQISLGDKVQVKIDDNEAENLEATISVIDPAETNTTGVSTYKVTLIPDFSVDKIKSGMTIDMILNFGERKNALIIPNASVLWEGEKSFVLVTSDDLQIKKEVKLGVADNSGNVELLSGIGEQDEIVSFSSVK